jgi:hypothetical protein
MLTVVGFPRSGTNFLTRMLAHYVDGPDAEVWDGMGMHPHVRKIHWAYQDIRFTAMPYIYRDPRDCALSGWEYIKHHYAPDVDLKLFLEHYFAGHWPLWPQGWGEHTRYWLDRGIVATVSYESLCSDRETVLRGLVSQLHGAVYEDRIAHAAEQSYNFGERHDGRWVDDLPKEAAAWLDGYCGDLMRELGYT